MPESEMWQEVVLTALRDVTAKFREADIDASDDVALQIAEIEQNRREADKWLRERRKDFRMVCDLAGWDADWIAEMYAAGRIDAIFLRTRNKKALQMVDDDV